MVTNIDKLSIACDPLLVINDDEHVAFLEKIGLLDTIRKEKLKKVKYINNIMYI